MKHRCDHIQFLSTRLLLDARSKIIDIVARPGIRLSVETSPSIPAIPRSSLSANPQHIFVHGISANAKVVEHLLKPHQPDAVAAENHEGHSITHLHG